MKKYIGTITKIRGYDGTLVVSDMPCELSIPVNTEIFIGFSEKFTKSYNISSWDMKSKKAFLKLQDVDNEKDASKLKEYGVFIEQELYEEIAHDLGLNQITDKYILIDEKNEKIGEIMEVWNLPANDVWLVNTDRGELPVPVLEDNILSIDTENYKIKYRVMDGLMDLLNNKRDDDE